MTRRWVLVAFAMGIGLATALVAPDPATAATCDRTVVAQSNLTFQAGTVTIAPGQTVCWTNPNSGFHNVHFEDGQFDVPASPSSSWPTEVARTFAATGAYRYYCEQHGSAGGGGMSGVVNVGEPASLSVTSALPNKLGQGATAAAVSVNGTGFVSGATVSVGGTGVTVTSTQFVSATKLTAKLNVAPTAPIGTRSVTVSQSGGTASCATCLTITTGPKPTSMSPTSGARGTAPNVTINGTGFVANAKVRPGAGIQVSNIVVVSATKITAKFTILSGAVKGKRTIGVVNPDKGTGKLVGGFTIT